MIEYRILFSLTDSVNDINAANDFLLESNMISSFKDSSDIPLDLEENVVEIKWKLSMETYGYIKVLSKDYLSESNLLYLKSWCNTQNLGEFGESFSQQPFANYSKTVTNYSDLKKEDKLALIRALRSSKPIQPTVDDSVVVEFKAFDFNSNFCIYNQW